MFAENHFQRLPQTHFGFGEQQRTGSFNMCFDTLRWQFINWLFGNALRGIIIYRLITENSRLNDHY